MSTHSTSRPLCPMHRIDLPEPGPPRPATLATGTPVWLVTRYADVRQVLMDPRFNRSSLHAGDAPNVIPGKAVNAACILAASKNGTASPVAAFTFCNRGTSRRDESFMSK